VNAPVHTRAYLDGVVVAEDFPVTEVSEHLARPGVIVWVDLRTPHHEDLQLLATELGLHDLAVEDALGPHQRPKLDHYDTHLFVACQVLGLGASGELRQTELDVFVDSRWLITVRKGDGFDLTPVVQRWDRAGSLAAHGVGFLLYALLDEIVDSYFDLVDRFDEYWDGVSEGLFADRPLSPGEQRMWFQMRRSLVRFHRLVVPMREIVSGLMRREQGTVGEELYPYFQDVYDHVLRITESIDSLRDLVGTIVETNLSLRDYRQNQVMKKVTSWAAILAVPTLVTGYYGMNVPFPGNGSLVGVVMSGALVVVLSAGLYVRFRRSDWL